MWTFHEELNIRILLHPRVDICCSGIRNQDHESDKWTVMDKDIRGSEEKKWTWNGMEFREDNESEFAIINQILSCLLEY